MGIIEEMKAAIVDHKAFKDAQKRWDYLRPMDVAQAMKVIGEPLVVRYTTRNVGMEWDVSLESDPMAHEHFASFEEGVMWMARNIRVLREPK